MDNLLTRHEAAHFCGVPFSFLENAARRRTGPAFLKFSRKTVRYRREDLQAWLDVQRVPPVAS